MLSNYLQRDASGYLSQQNNPLNPTGPAGTNIAISGGLTVIPYINSTSQSPTNSPCWQLYYANQTITFSQIIQYTYLSGSNTWSWYISIAPTINSLNFASATVSTTIGTTNTSYTSGGTTTTNVISRTVQAGYYFLIGCKDGPYYKTFNTASQNYVFTLSGIPKVTMINKCYWRNHGAVDQTMSIPAQLGGSGTYNAPVNTIWCINLGGIS